MRVRAIFLLPLLLLPPACSSVPGTGRSRLNFMSLEQEMSLGADAYAEALSGARIVTNGPDYEMVQRIGQRLARSADRLYPDPAKRFDWEFTLIDDPQMVNAWALPGGKCAVYTGILPVTQDEDSLAAVMGHELAHAIASHGAERMSQAGLLQGGLIVTDLFLKSKDISASDRNSALAALGAGSTVGIMLPFSRTHESEADELGVYIAANASYDPRAAIGLWQRMAELGGDRPPEFLSTHPSEQTRIRRLRSVMPKAMRYYKKAQRGS